VAKLKKGLKKKTKSGRSIQDTQVQPREAKAHMLFLARERHELDIKLRIKELKSLRSIEAKRKLRDTNNI
jgi:hypothetical protein